MARARTTLPITCSVRRDCLTVVLLLAAACTSLAESSVAELAEPTLLERLELPLAEPIRLGSYLEVATTANAQTRPGPLDWRPIEHDTYSTGFDQKSHWLRLRTSLPQDLSPARWYFLLNAGNIDTVEFRHYIDGELISRDIAGTGHSFDTRPVAYRQLIFPIAMRAGEHQMLVRLSSIANFSIVPELATAPVWFESESIHQTIIAALLGVLLMLAIYNGVVFVMSREVVFLIFSLTLAAGILWRLAITGYASQYLYPDAPLLHDNVLRLAAGAFLTGLILLANELLHVVRWSSKLSHALKSSAMLMAVTIALPVFGFAPAFGLLVIVLSMFLILATAILAVRKSVPAASAFLGALAFAFSGLTFTLLKSYGILPAEFLSLYTGELTVVALGVMTSVSLAHRLGEEKTARHLAQKDAAAKSQFLANMSHEIRTPLNAIVGFAELLATDSGIPDSQKEKAERIHRASEKLLGVLNDVLDFSKIDAGKVRLDVQPFRLDCLIDDLFILFKQQAQTARLDLRFDVDENIAGSLMGDSQRLHQVLANLISNAIKFTEQGSITLTVSDVASSDAANFIEFRLTDTGIGMAEEHVGRLFQPFEQADASTTRRFGGTGLGLAISHRLVALMGGQLKVASEPRQGSSFWFQLNLPTASMSSTTENSNAALPGSLASDTRVLIVEDNRTNQILAQAMLKKLGSACVVADNGAVALEILEASRDDPFDLVLMDCQMPVMDGYQATRGIRQSAYGQTLPVIAMTANALDGDRQRCLDAGMSDYITKPVSLASLHTVVQRWHATDHELQS